MTLFDKIVKILKLSEDDINHLYKLVKNKDNETEIYITLDYYFDYLSVKNETIQTQEFIKQIGDEYCVFSHQTGKNFGCYKTKDEAEKRLAQIKQFK